MEYHCYIIYSKSVDRFYMGETVDIEVRLNQHNTSFFKASSTKKAKDWELFLLIKCDDRSHARKVEGYVKRMKSSVFIKKLKIEPKLLQDIINKNK